jgi:hypothetical protein
VKPLFFSALVMLSSCAVESHALARRDEVRKYRAEHPPVPPSIDADGQLGPWHWGMTPADVLAVTPNAWSEGENLSGPVDLGVTHGLATFSFDQGALTGLTVVAPNQPGVEQALRGKYLQALGGGIETCKGCDLKHAAVATGVADAIGGTLLLGLGIAGIATGHPFSLQPPPLYDPAWPWMVAANADEPVRSVDWATATTQAHLGVDGASLVFSARVRPGRLASASDVAP